MACSVHVESFVICLEKCDVEVVENILLDTTDHLDSQRSQITLPAGYLAKVKEVHSSHKTCLIRIYDFYNRNLAFENNLFACAVADLRTVAPPLWPFLIGIREPKERVQFFRNHELIAYLLSLQCQDFVLVARDSVEPGSTFNGSGSDPSYFTCIIRYIGLVSEIGPGFYLGVEITDDLEDDREKQVEYRGFINSYVQSRTNPAVLIRANDILLPETITVGSKNKSSPSSKEYLTKLFSTTVEKARNEFSTRASTLRRSKRNRLEDRQKRLSWNADSNNYSDQQMQTATGVGLDEIDSKMADANYRINANATAIGQVTSDGSDKSTSTKSSQLTNASSTASSGGSKGAKKKTATGSKPPTTTILSLEDRDLVIIDGNDIKESVQNESEVIVVDHPPKESGTSGEVDLMDILGKDWPALAGDTARVLNDRRSSSSSGGQVMKPSLGELMLPTRNKSLNIISHLTKSGSSAGKGSTLPRTSGGHGQGHHQHSASVGGSVNSSFESSYSGDRSGTGERKKKSLESPVYDNLANASAELSSRRFSIPPEEEEFEPVPLTEVPNSKLGLGSMVEVQLKDTSLYGVIQWIGLKQPGNLNSCLVGVEMDDEPLPEEILPVQYTLSDGMYAGVRIFKCPPNRAIFVAPGKVAKDRRFQDQPPASGSGKAGSSKQVDNYKMFGQKDCPVVPGFVPPLKILAPSDLEKVCGKFKGIQGHHNSCYLDATLFSMFTFTSVFDSLLFRPPDAKDIGSYEEVQTVLRDEIVNPLRKNLFVRADRVMKLRKLLDRLSSVTGLMTEEKDPEEFLNSLLAQILRVQPFLKLSSGQDAYFYQLFVERDERLSFPSVQQLFEQSFLQSDIKLKEVPSCLIIQMPRFGKDYKLYPRILPSLVLDVTHIIEDSPRPCSVCNNLALFECKDCFGTMNCVDAFESTAFCSECLERTHTVATGRQNHNTRPVSVPEDFVRMSANNCITVPHLFMELFAVVCIETSHYVSFVKAGSGQDAPWCFFDSMADRKGEINGYNIPEMLSVSELAQWLSEDGAHELNESFASDKMLPEHARRLFCDAYMCMYQSSDIMMYR